MEKNGSVPTPGTANIALRVRVLVVQIDNRHLFAHDVTSEPFAARPIERCSNFYRRQKRFANSHFRFEVAEVTAAPTEEVA